MVTNDIYRVYAYDINTNTLLTELPAENLTFSGRLNDAGTISFDLPISRPSVASRAKPIMAYNGNPFAVYVDKDGLIEWGGVIWTWNYNRASGILTLGGKEWLSYFAQRTIAADYSATSYPSGIDPALLAYKAVYDAQAAGTGANVGIVTTSTTSTIPAITPGYPLTGRTTVANVLKDLASISSPGNGTVDTVFDWAWVSGSPVTTMTISSPRAGRVGAASGLAFDLSRVIDYSYPTDAQQAGTKIVATGGGAGLSSTVNTTQPVGGLGQMPRLDKVISFSNVQSQTQLDAMAAGLPTQFGQPVPTPTVTQPTSVAPRLNTFSIGDDARLYIAADERFPSGLNEYWRIVQYSVKVPNEGVPTITFTFNKPPTF